MASVQINASFADGATLHQFGKIIAERMKWMRETARDSIAACAINVLKSIRTITRVAKLSSIKVNVKVDTTLYPSYFTQSAKKSLCVRYRGSNQRYHGEEKVVAAEAPSKISTWLVFRWQDTLDPKLRSYLIIAPSASSAKAKAKSIVRARQIRYAGLAKRALGVLMHKTATNQNPQDNVPRQVTAKAQQLTTAKEIIAKSNDGNGGKYSLVLYDNLRYAADAVKGGRQAVNVQMKKAMNKIVSIINKKIPDGGTFFGPKKLATPFPEVVRKRK